MTLNLYISYCLFLWKFLTSSCPGVEYLKKTALKPERWYRLYNMQNEEILVLPTPLAKERKK